MALKFPIRIAHFSLRAGARRRYAAMVQQWGIPVTVGMLLLALWILILIVTTIQKQRLLEGSYHELAQLDNAVARYAASMLGDIETSFRVMDRVLQANAVDPRNDSQFGALVAELRLTSKGRVDPTLVAGDGRVQGIAGRDVASTNYVYPGGAFKDRATLAEGRLAIGNPVQNPRTSAWETPVFWRLAAPVAGIEWFMALADLSALDIVQEDMGLRSRGVMVIRADGVVLSGTAADNLKAGQNISATADFATEFGKKIVGTFVSNGDSGDLMRLISYTRLSDYPLVVMVSRDIEEVLADYYARRWLVIGITGLLTLLAVSLTRSVMVSQHALQLAKAELQKLEATDTLTGVMSRRVFLEHVQREIRRCTRYERQSAILMLDLDEFKKINDSYGHRAGDEVLTSCANIWRASLREQDLLGRLGGEEFCVVLPETAFESSKLVAERLRKKVQELRFNFGGHEIAVSVSIGLTMVAADDLEPAAPIDRADRALYRAKGLGRDRVEVALGPVIEGG